MTRPPVAESTTVSVAKHLVAAEAQDDTIILDPVASRYFGLAEVGSRVWDLLQTPRRVGDLRDAIVAEYEVDPDVALADLLRLVTELAEAGLVDVDHGQAR